MKSVIYVMILLSIHMILMCFSLEPRNLEEFHKVQSNVEFEYTLYFDGFNTSIDYREDSIPSFLTSSLGAYYYREGLPSDFSDAVIYKNYAFVCYQGNGLDLYSLNSTFPHQLSFLKKIHYHKSISVVVKGDYMYCLLEEGLAIYNITNLPDFQMINYISVSTPRGMNLPDPTKDVLYIANEDSTIVFDIKDPSAPIGTSFLISNIGKTFIYHNGLLFLSVYSSANFVLKASDLLNPSLVGSGYFYNPAGHAVIHGDYMFQFIYRDLYIYSVPSSPTDYIPSQLDYTTIYYFLPESYAQDVVLVNNEYILVVCSSDRAVVHLVDIISDPLAPTIVLTHYPEILHKQLKITIIDVLNSSDDDDDNNNNIKYFLVYDSDPKIELMMLNLTNFSISTISSIDRSRDIRRVFYDSSSGEEEDDDDDHLLYTWDEKNGVISVMNVSDIFHPKLIRELDDEDLCYCSSSETYCRSVGDMIIHKNKEEEDSAKIAYIACTEMLIVANFSNIMNISVLSKSTSLYDFKELELVRDGSQLLLFFVSGSEFGVYNVTDSFSDPILIYKTSSLYSEGIYVYDNNFAFVSTHIQYIYIFNISNLMNMEMTSTFYSEEFRCDNYRMDGNQNYLFVYDVSGIRVVDVSDPLSPTFAAIISPDLNPNGYFYDPKTDLFAVCSHSFGVRVYYLKEPENYQPVVFIETFKSMDVSIDKNVIFSAAGEGGLDILGPDAIRFTGIASESDCGKDYTVKFTVWDLSENTIDVNYTIRVGCGQVDYKGPNDPNLDDSNSGNDGGEVNDGEALLISIIGSILTMAGLALCVCILFVLVPCCIFFALILVLCLILCIPVCGFLLLVCGGSGLGVFGTILGKKYYERKYQLDKFDLVEKQEDGIAHININKGLFEISYGNLKVVKMIGEGGSSSTVYHCTWTGKDVAFKCFNTSKIMNSQNHFDEFEREVEVLSSITHPYCLKFYGCTLHPPRVGIVMEFCPNGDLKRYLSNNNNGSDEPVELGVRLRILMESSDGMEYLHDRNVIHRDLKSENILLAEDLSARLIDFGLSRIVARMDVAKTKNIGTQNYMAPEIILAANYNEKVDVFSFAIVIWEVLTFNFEPYGTYDVSGGSHEYKVANDEWFRPDVYMIQKEVRLEVPEIIEIMKKSWSGIPDNRPSFREIKECIENVLKKNEELPKILEEERAVSDIISVNDELDGVVNFDEEERKRGEKKDVDQKKVEIVEIE